MPFLQFCRNRIVRLLLFVSFTAGLSHAQDWVQSEQGLQHGKLWKASLLALAGGAAADIHSSWNREELNPLLRDPNGRFSRQGVALKVSLLSGFVALEQFLLPKRQQLRKPFAVINFVVASSSGVLAVRNYSTK